MSPITLMRKIVSPLLFLNIISRYKGRSALMKIKAAHVYVTGVKKTRIFFLGISVVMVSLILLGSGLYLIHAGLFTYSLWSFKVKFIIALALGGGEFLGAIIILLFLFREESFKGKIE